MSFHTTAMKVDQARLTLYTLADLPIWVAWREELDSKGKPTKVPYSPRSKWKASSTDPKTWSSRVVAQKRATELFEDRPTGIGIILGPLPSMPGLRLAGIDLDSCLDPETGEIAPWAEAVVSRFGSYTELSPSGTGLHVLFLCHEEDFAALRDFGSVTPAGGAEFSIGKHIEIAAFLGGRYFTVTQQPYSPQDDLLGPGETIHPVRLVDLQWLLDEHGPAFKRSVDKEGSSPSAGDQSGSGIAFRFAMDLARKGLSQEEARDAFWADDSPAGEWWGRTTDREQLRTIDRAFLAVAARREENRDTFDDILGPVPDPSERKPQPSELGKYPPDEAGAILAFTDHHAGQLLFDHNAGKWFRFDGNHWRREETQLAADYARDLAVAMAAHDPKAKALRKVSTSESIERGARRVRQFACTSAEWNRDQMLLGTPGGTVELRTGLLRPGRPEDRISKVTAAAPVPLDRFDPARDCPTWLAFLDHALNGDAEAIRFFAQWCGYCLTGDTQEQALLFVYGPGGSGKSTAINTIAEVLGDYSCNVAASTLTAKTHEAHPEEIARLDGARLAFASETEKGSRWAENRIKSITGGDPMTARHMRQNSFTFIPRAKFVVVGNNAPTLADVDAAIRRRFNILPFNHPPTQKDQTLSDKLRRELPGILSWMIVGCLDWQAVGLIRPGVVQQATDSYFNEQDTFTQWVDECCEVGVGFSETTARLWESWQKFALRLGIAPGNRIRTFPETLSQKGFSSGKNIGPTRGRGFTGLKLAEGGAGTEGWDD